MVRTDLKLEPEITDVNKRAAAGGISVNCHTVQVSEPQRGTAAKERQVKSAGRVLDLMTGLAAAPNGLAFADLARLHHLPKSSLHGLLTVLTARGFAEYDPDLRMYSLGIRAWEIGQAYLHHQNLVRDALPLMERVVETINETVQLATLDGVENVYLAKVDCSHPLRLQSEVGGRIPAHATGLGKVLLAFLSQDELAARYRDVAIEGFNSNTIRTFSGLTAALDTVRRRGFALDDEEFTLGLRCVAVPIFGLGGDASFALSASVPLTRADDDHLSRALREIATASIDLSRRIGCLTLDRRIVALTGRRQSVLESSSLDLERGPPAIDHS